ncbi:MAG TPA: hypothetical protein ENK12_04775 [Gammaproteobacteria bacterium]|nr:hypothetical protein [Gammaproteobacteria bacterium]
MRFPDLPGWVAWVAQDADGVWWGYEAEPHQHARGWYENEVGRCLRLGAGPPAPDWRDSLEAVT